MNIMDSVERPGGGTVEIELFTQPRFRCPTCRKSWASKSRCRDHIKAGCWHDPANRGCRTCREYEPGSTGDSTIGDPGVEPHCMVDAPDSSGDLFNEPYEDPLTGQTITPARTIFGGDIVLCDYWAPVDKADNPATEETTHE